MARKKVSYTHKLARTLALLADPGLLLVSSKRSGESNVMTIGWATVGIIWGKPIFVVMVRPSRYTYEFIEDSGDFTVNVPTMEMRDWVMVCGTKSGRELDKFKAYNVPTEQAKHVPSIVIAENLTRFSPAGPITALLISSSPKASLIAH